MFPTVLLILDGWGIAPKTKGNAIENARKPNFDKAWDKYPKAQLFAHGKHVGLPDNQVGNSEAGHLNIGAGRLVKQDSVIISEAIKNGVFYKNTALLESIKHVLKNKSALHLFGLVSDQESPHSSLNHLYSLVELAKKKGVEKIFLHLITDGRDSPQYEAMNILKKIEENVNGFASVVSLMGRFYAMDRGKNWERTKVAYNCLTLGSGDLFSDTQSAILHNYNKKITDEFIYPTVIASNKKRLEQTRVSDNDSVIFFNLRSDRARQLSKCFVQEKFNQLNPGSFVRKKVIKNLKFCAFTDFGPDLDSILTAFPSFEVYNSIPLVLQKYRQLYIAETEKYAHMTYFINGGFANEINGEDWLRIPSKKVTGYDLIPEMSVYEITSTVLHFLKLDKYQFIAINFANPDMVGHAGNLKATIKAIEHTDICLGKIVEAVLAKGGNVLITADHGNAEKMIDEKNGEIWTSHTTNKVPFILVSNNYKNRRLVEGSLGNIAPTIYEIMEVSTLPETIYSSLIQ